MKKELNKKTIILIAVSILCLIGAIIMIKLSLKPKKNDDRFKIDGIEITENKDMLKDAKIDNLDVTNQVLYNENGVTVFSGTIKNNTENDYNINKLYIIFTINNKEEKLLLINNGKIKKESVFPINITFDKDMLSTTNIQYVIED